MSDSVIQKLGCAMVAVEKPLEGTMGASSLLAYRELLERYYGFCAPLEGRLSGYAHWAPLKFHRRRKTPLLAQDLFDLSDPSFELGMISLCDDLPDVMQLPQALGCIYVIEAIAYNGRAIATTLAGQMGLSGSQGVNFFGVYGADAGAMWDELLELVKACSSKKTDGMMIQSAHATVSKLSRWMSRPRCEVARGEQYVGFPRAAM